MSWFLMASLLLYHVQIGRSSKVLEWQSVGSKNSPATKPQSFNLIAKLKKKGIQSEEETIIIVYWSLLSKVRYALQITRYTWHEISFWSWQKKKCWKIYPNLGLISGWDFFYSSSSTLIKVNYGRHNKVVITNQFCTYETFFTFIYLAVRCNSSALCCLIYQVTIRVGRAQCFEINKKVALLARVKWATIILARIIVARFVTKLDRLGQFSYTVDVKRTLFIL